MAAMAVDTKNDQNGIAAPTDLARHPVRRARRHTGYEAVSSRGSPRNSGARARRMLLRPRLASRPGRHCCHHDCRGRGCNERDIFRRAGLPGVHAGHHDRRSRERGWREYPDVAAKPEGRRGPASPGPHRAVHRRLGRSVSHVSDRPGSGGRHEVVRPRTSSGPARTLADLRAVPVGENSGSWNRRCRIMP